MTRRLGGRKLDRREFLVSAGVLSTGTLAPLRTVTAVEEESPGRSLAQPMKLVDTNVWLFRWPYRRLPYDGTDELAAFLRKNHVTQAWAGSFEALLHRDIAGVNARLIEECARFPDLFVPCPTIHPGLPDWLEDFRTCVDHWHSRIVRLIPNYHGYSLDSPEAESLLRLAAEAGVVVQIAVEMEDERTQHPLGRVSPVNLDPLDRILRQIPHLKVMLLNVHRRSAPARLRQWMDAGRVFVDLTMLEGIGGLERLLALVPGERVCFGSFTPLFYFEAATLKLVESALSPDVLGTITLDNALSLLTSVPQ